MAIHEVEQQIQFGVFPARVRPKFELPIERQDRAALAARYIFDRCQTIGLPERVQLSNAGIIAVTKHLVTPDIGPQHEVNTVLHRTDGIHTATSLLRVVDAAEALKYGISREIHAETHPYPDFELGILPDDVCFVSPVNDDLFEAVVEPFAVLQEVIDSQRATV